MNLKNKWPIVLGHLSGCKSYSEPQTQFIKHGYLNPLKIKMINIKETKHKATFIKVNEVQSHLDNLPIHYWTLLSYQHSSLHLNSH